MGLAFRLCCADPNVPVYLGILCVPSPVLYCTVLPLDCTSPTTHHRLVRMYRPHYRVQHVVACNGTLAAGIRMRLRASTCCCEAIFPSIDVSLSVGEGSLLYCSHLHIHRLSHFFFRAPHPVTPTRPPSLSQHNIQLTHNLNRVYLATSLPYTRQSLTRHCQLIFSAQSDSDVPPPPPPHQRDKFTRSAQKAPPVMCAAARPATVLDSCTPPGTLAIN